MNRIMSIFMILIVFFAVFSFADDSRSHLIDETLATFDLLNETISVLIMQADYLLQQDITRAERNYWESKLGMYNEIKDIVEEHIGFLNDAKTNPSISKNDIKEATNEAINNILDLLVSCKSSDECIAWPRCKIATCIPCDGCPEPTYTNICTCEQGDCVQMIGLEQPENYCGCDNDGECEAESGETAETCPEDCAEQRCELINAFWSTTVTTNGSNVDLIVYGNNCDGKDVEFKLWEDDEQEFGLLSFVAGIFLNNTYIADLGNASFSNGVATLSWDAQWIDDGMWQGDPEYFFNASLVDNESVSIKSGLMVVTLTKTCSELGGAICNESEECNGSFVIASDSDRCCVNGGCEALVCQDDSNCTGTDESCYCESGVCKACAQGELCVNHQCIELIETCDASNACEEAVIDGMQYTCHFTNDGEWEWSPGRLQQEINCNDGYDNDCDGKIDGDDDYCSALPGPCAVNSSCTFRQKCRCPLTKGVCGIVGYQTCTNKGKWPGCFGGSAWTAYGLYYEENEVSCTDERDNDCDGLTDMDDPDCEGGPFCTKWDLKRAYFSLRDGGTGGWYRDLVVVNGTTVYLNLKTNKVCAGQNVRFDLIRYVNASISPDHKKSVTTLTSTVDENGLARVKWTAIWFEDAYYPGRTIYKFTANIPGVGSKRSYRGRDDRGEKLIVWKSMEGCTNRPGAPSCKGVVGNCPKQQGVCEGSYRIYKVNSDAWPDCTASNYGRNYQETESSCRDELDNDCDGLIDSEDDCCYDSDEYPGYYGGPLKKGYVIYHGEKTWDYCKDDKILVEMRCNWNNLTEEPKEKEYNCDEYSTTYITWGCYDGRCRKLDGLPPENHSPRASLSYSGDCMEGETITLKCTATDPDQADNTLDVRVWIGLCDDPDDCDKYTVSWIIDEGAMSTPASGSIFTKTFTIPQGSAGKAIAATCNVTDDQGASKWGDMYPLCTVTQGLAEQYQFLFRKGFRYNEYGVGFDKNNNLLYVETGPRYHHRIHKLDSKGNEIKSWEIYGDVSTGIDVDNNGNIFVSNGNNRKVQEWDKDGNLVKEWSLHKCVVKDVAVSGNYVYAICSIDNVWRINTETDEKTLFIINPSTNYPLGLGKIAADSNTVYIIYGNAVNKYGTDLDFIGKFKPEILSNPKDVEISGNNIYVIDSNYVYKFDKDGNLLARFAASGGYIAVDGYENIYITSNGVSKYGLKSSSCQELGGNECCDGTGYKCYGTTAVASDCNECCISGKADSGICRWEQLTTCSGEDEGNEPGDCSDYMKWGRVIYSHRRIDWRNKGMDCAIQKCVHYKDYSVHTGDKACCPQDYCVYNGRCYAPSKQAYCINGVEQYCSYRYDNGWLGVWFAKQQPCTLQDCELEFINFTAECEKGSFCCQNDSGDKLMFTGKISGDCDDENLYLDVKFREAGAGHYLNIKNVPVIIDGSTITGEWIINSSAIPGSYGHYYPFKPQEAKLHCYAESAGKKRLITKTSNIGKTPEYYFDKKSHWHNSFRIIPLGSGIFGCAAGCGDGCLVVGGEYCSRSCVQGCPICEGGEMLECPDTEYCCVGGTCTYPG